LILGKKFRLVFVQVIGKFLGNDVFFAQEVEGEAG
jgi:hypothetical protein